MDGQESRRAGGCKSAKPARSSHCDVRSTKMQENWAQPSWGAWPPTGQWLPAANLACLLAGGRITSACCCFSVCLFPKNLQIIGFKWIILMKERRMCRDEDVQVSTCSSWDQYPYTPAPLPQVFPDIPIFSKETGKAHF